MNTEIGKHSAFVDARAGPWCLGRRVARRFLGGFVGLPGRPAWRAVVLIVVCVLLSFPAWAEQNDLEPVEEQAEESESIARISCRDELDRPESWLDRSHSYLSRRLCEPAAWFDGFFGDPRAFEETPVGTFFRLRNSLQWDETEGFGFRVRVRANILLPRVSERVRLLITRDEDISGDFQDDPDRFDDDRTRLGLRFIASGNRRSQFDIDGTIRLSSGSLNPRARARYRVVHGLTSSSLIRGTQSVFWERVDGFGTTSRVDLEWLPSRDGLVRWTTQGTVSEGSDGIDWRTSVTAFRQLTRRSAIGTQVGMFGFTRPSFEVEEYFARFRYRRQFLRSWLFYELQPEYAWPLAEDLSTRRGDWRFTFTLEVQFENERSRSHRLKRYLGGDEDEIEEWDKEHSIPVEVPGWRAQDPVLRQDAPSRDDEEREDGEDGDGKDGDGKDGNFSDGA